MYVQGLRRRMTPMAQTITTPRLWLKAGGRRIDTALCYHTQAQVGRAIIDSRVPRHEIFVTSKLANCGGGMQVFLAWALFLTISFLISQPYTGPNVNVSCAVPFVAGCPPTKSNQK